MNKGLMDRCMSQEMVVSCLWEKAETTETKLRELHAWRVVQLQKFDLTKKSLEESKKQAQALGNILKDKEDKISKLKNQLRRAKEDEIKEYRNSDALLYELGGSFADSFDNCLHQVKASFLDLDLSQISIDTQAQTPTCPIDPEGTDKLFADNATPDPQGDRETDPHDDKVKSVKNETSPLEEGQRAKEKDGETPVDQQQIYLNVFIYFFYF